MNRFSLLSIVILSCVHVALFISTTTRARAQSVTKTVSSQEAWQDTGVDVNAGETISISASGVITFDSAGHTSTPDGLLTFATVNPDGTCNYLLCGPTIPTHSLVSRIGSSSLTDFTTGFFVGSNFSAPAPTSGRLFLGFNDGFVKPDRTGLDSGAVQDNSGSFSATITTKPLVAYYALGDSVASGRGLPGDDGTECRRSPAAYPLLVESALSDLNVTYIDIVGGRACSGRTSDHLNDQVKAVLEDLSIRKQANPTLRALVTITIGANDFQWSNLNELRKHICDPTHPFNKWVKDKTSGVGKKPGVEGNLKLAFQQLVSRDNVFVIVTDYHNPFNRDSNVLRLFTNLLSPYYQPACPRQGFFFASDLYPRTETVVQALNDTLAAVVAEFPPYAGLATVHQKFLGPPRRESAAPTCGLDLFGPTEFTTWVQSVGNFFDLLEGRFLDCFHPNVSGAQAFSKAVEEIARQLLR